MQNDIETVSKEEVANHIRNGTAIVINVLASQTYNDLHIKGSISIPFDKLENGEWKTLDRSKVVITYCASYSCGASKRAAQILKENGFNAKAYEGGIKEWSESRMPVEGHKS